METLGERIKKHRKALKLTQVNLAKLVGVSHVTICQWESDINHPKTENFLNLARSLELSIEELLTDLNTSVMDDETFLGIVKASYPRLPADKRKALIAFLVDLEVSKNLVK